MLRKIFISSFVFLLLASPLFVLGQEPKLIFCNTTVDPNTGQFTDPCTFNSLIDLGQRVINFLIILAVPLAAVSFAWSGWMILSAGGDEGKVKKGKEIFKKVGTGLIFVIAAWLIVNVILTALLKDPTGYSRLGPSS